MRSYKKQGKNESMRNRDVNICIPAILIEVMPNYSVTVEVKSEIEI